MRSLKRQPKSPSRCTKMSCGPCLSEYENLVVLRTFSKAMALAALRVGYLLAAPELASEIVKAQCKQENETNHDLRLLIEQNYVSKILCGFVDYATRFYYHSPAMQVKEKIPAAGSRSLRLFAILSIQPG